jgi:hypothetical protein
MRIELKRRERYGCYGQTRSSASGDGKTGKKLERKIGEMTKFQMTVTKQLTLNNSKVDSKFVNPL